MDHGLLRRVGRTGVLSLVLVLIAGPSAHGGPEVPFGDEVSEAIVNYNRTTPHIATAGILKPGGVEELKRLGFTAVVDLRTAEEGALEEKAEVEASGMLYFNIPVATRAPTDQQVRQFAAVVEDGENYPLLVHCVSANRSGAMWALYRLSTGVPFDIAIQEGRTAGLKPSRENAIRKRLGKPLLPE